MSAPGREPPIGRLRPGWPQTGGAAVVHALERNGVRFVFGIPGTHNLEIYRYLGDSPIEHVTVRHEQGAGYAADGYARSSGEPGVCLTTSGPGLTNACTAAATAYADSVPLLLVSPGVPRGAVGLDLGLLHEVKDQQAHAASLVNAAIRVSSADEIGDVVDEAFGGWQQRRPRPVYLEVPVDVLEAPWSAPAGAQSGSLPRGAGYGPPPRSDHDGDVGSVVSALRRARRPVLVLGGGARRASTEVAKLTERLGALVVTTVNGKGTFPERHPRSLGASIRLPATRQVLRVADVVVVIGSELGDSDLWGHPVVTDALVVRIDIDADQLGKNLTASVAVRGDASAVLRLVLDGLAVGASPAAGAGANTSAGETGWSDPDAAAWRDLLDGEALADGGAYRAINAALSSALPGETIVAGDSAQVSYFGTAHFWPMDRPGRFLYPTGYATLGYGLPAAIGAKLANPDAPVIALVGDGGFLFTAPEILTAVERRLPLPVVIVDNHGFAEIREGMQARGIPPLGVDVPHVDFATLSVALGGHGHAARDLDDLCQLVLAALHADGPTVVSVDLASPGWAAKGG